MTRYSKELVQLLEKHGRPVPPELAHAVQAEDARINEALSAYRRSMIDTGKGLIEKVLGPEKMAKLVAVTEKNPQAAIAFLDSPAGAELIGLVIDEVVKFLEAQSEQA